MLEKRDPPALRLGEDTSRGGRSNSRGGISALVEMFLQFADLVGQSVQLSPRHSPAAVGQLGGVNSISPPLSQLGPHLL